jgi:membrane-associated phospholipid phosphatase
MSERETARALALTSAAMMDATIAAHDAKYTYWFVRPSQTDPAIGLAVGLPAHPSYPSNHTAISVAAATVLGALFPAEAARLDSVAAEAGASRLYGGIHYRFDIDAGAAMGRAIGRAALATGIAAR